MNISSDLALQMKMVEEAHSPLTILCSDEAKGWMTLPNWTIDTQMVHRSVDSLKSEGQSIRIIWLLDEQLIL